MTQSCAPHTLLEWAAIVNGEVTLAWLPVIDTVEALNRAVAEDPAVLSLVGTLVGVFLGGVVWEAADVTADILGWALTFVRRVGEDVTAGALSEGDELAHEAYS